MGISLERTSNHSERDYSLSGKFKTSWQIPALADLEAKDLSDSETVGQTKSRDLYQALPNSTRKTSNCNVVLSQSLLKNPEIAKFAVANASLCLRVDDSGEKKPEGIFKCGLLDKPKRFPVITLPPYSRTNLEKNDHRLMIGRNPNSDRSLNKNSAFKNCKPIRLNSQCEYVSSQAERSRSNSSQTCLIDYCKDSRSKSICIKAPATNPGSKELRLSIQKGLNSQRTSLERSTPYYRSRNWSIGRTEGHEKSLEASYSSKLDTRRLPVAAKANPICSGVRGGLIQERSVDRSSEKVNIPDKVAQSSIKSRSNRDMFHARSETGQSTVGSSDKKARLWVNTSTLKNITENTIVESYAQKFKQKRLSLKKSASKSKNTPAGIEISRGSAYFGHKPSKFKLVSGKLHAPEPIYNVNFEAVPCESLANAAYCNNRYKS